MNFQNKVYRDKGAIGALLDEYEKALEELISILNQISSEELTTIVDKETKNADCRSIQTILSHVIRAGYSYSVFVRNHMGETAERPAKIKLASIDKYILSLKEMFQYNLEMFEKYPNIKLEEYDADKKFLTSWGQLYDVEQIYEHAIVHILRHRRQIERFLQKLRA